MRVASLHIYPVKSTDVLDLQDAVIEPWGLRHDRRWMVVDSDGENITARTGAALLSVTALPDSEHGLRLSAPGRASIRLVRPIENVPVPVTLSRLDRAVAVDPAADDWISMVVGRPARLVWLDDPRRRDVGAHHGGQRHDVMSLADAGPVLLTTRASLGRLNEWVAETAAGLGEPTPEPLTMQRFRPNVVVDGVEVPFVEDGWSSVRIGGVTFRMGEHCDRCVLTTIHPELLTKGKEPIRTLARHRRWDGKVFFGVRLIPTNTGTIRLGDSVIAE